MHLQNSLNRLAELPYGLLPWRFDTQVFIQHHPELKSLLVAEDPQGIYATALLSLLLSQKNLLNLPAKNRQAFLDHTRQMALSHISNSAWHREQFVRVVAHSLGLHFDDEKTTHTAKIWSQFNPLENQRLHHEKDRLLKRQQAVKAALERAQQLDIGD